MIGNTSLRSFSSRDLGQTRISRLEKSFCSSNLDQVTMKTKVQSQPFSTSTSSLPHSPLPHTRDLVPLRTLQRRCFTRHTSTAPSPTVFYAVRLGHVPGIYISCRVAQPQTVGIPADVKRHSTTKAEKYMAKSTGPGDPLFDDPAAFLFTDDSALPSGSAGWGSTSSSRVETPPGRYGAQCPRPPLALIGLVLGEPPAIPENLVPCTTPSTGSKSGASTWIRPPPRATLSSPTAIVV